jgi:hypothetical protein
MFVSVYHDLLTRVNASESSGLPVDFEILLKLLAEIEFCQQAVRGGHDGSIRMNATGCTVYFTTHEALANRMAVPVPRLQQALANLREAQIIVAEGDGWIEFDASLVWRGYYRQREPYIEWQTKRGSDRSGQPGLRQTNENGASSNAVFRRRVTAASTRPPK